MNAIAEFKPKRDLTALQNLEAFISLSRDQLTLWSNLPGFNWNNAERWPTTFKTITFLSLEHTHLAKSKTIPAEALLHPNFILFAKAYLRYSHTLHDTKTLDVEIKSLRVIEHVLRKNALTPDITQFSRRHFDAAVELLEPVPNRQDVCNCILKILAAMAKLYIVTGDALSWRHPYKGKLSYDSLNGAGASAEVKDSKVADQDALLAIANVFSQGLTSSISDVDTMITSTTAILLSAPMRINEVRRLRTNCVDHDTNKDGKIEHFLKYYVPKTGQFTRKGIPAVIFEVTEIAIDRLITITEEGRRLALYMESEPTRFYRHQDCPSVSDEEELTPTQIAQALGYSSRRSASDFLFRHTGSRSGKGYSLNSLWQLVIAEHKSLNPHFPYQEDPDAQKHTPLKMSESLMCFRRNQLGTRSGTSPVLLSPFSGDAYSLRLGAEVSHDALNFFTRHGYDSLKLNSHGIRHLLNRLAKQSGIPIELITEWSARASVKQTRTYLHDDQAQVAARAAAALGTIQEQTPLNPITEEEALLYRQGPYHRSRYGMCRRSWRMGPCNKFADCLNCSELLMCKGDKIALELVQQDHDNLAHTYKAAKEAISQGERSATRWTEVAEVQIPRLIELLEVLQDPNIPDGSPIEIAGEDFSHERVIVSQKAEAAGIRLLDRRSLALTYSQELLECLDTLLDDEDA